MFSFHTTPEEFENGGFSHSENSSNVFLPPTPEEFENGCFILKTHQMFSFHTTPEEFKNSTITGPDFGFVFEETSVRELAQLP